MIHSRGNGRASFISVLKAVNVKILVAGPVMLRYCYDINIKTYETVQFTDARNDVTT